MSCVWIINQYASTPETGIGGRHHYFAQALAKQGHDVVLIGASWHHLLHGDALKTDAPAIDARGDYTFVRIKVPTYDNAKAAKRVLNWVLFSRGLRRLPHMMAQAPDTILYSSPSLLGFQGAAKLAKKCKARLVFEVRDIWPLTLQEIGGHSPKHPFIRYMQYIEDRAYRISDAVISNLPNANVHMTQRGMNSEKFAWIPNGFFEAEVTAALPLNAKTHSLLPRDKFIVGYTGTFGSANALMTFIDAAETLRDRNDIAFALVGHGREKANLTQVIATRNLKNVHILDSIPKAEIQAMLATFDVCYIGLTRDPLFRFGVSPNKLFDYLAAGKPIIYGIDSGAYRPVDDIGAGIQVPPEDGQAVANAILTLAQTPKSDLIAMGARGRKAVFADYEYTVLAEKLAQVLFPKPI